MEIHRLLEGLPEALLEERFETLVQAGEVRIERILSTGQRSPEGFWYDADDEEWVCVLQGSAVLTFEHPRRAITLGPGDAVWIHAHERHRVEWTDPRQPTVWLAVHFPSASLGGTSSTG